MRIEKLSLSHKTLLRDKLKNADTYCSEYSFANLYLFSGKHKNEVIFDKDMFIRGNTYDGHSHLLPVSGVRAMDKAYMKEVSGLADFFYPIPEPWLTAFPPDEYESYFNPDDSDYVYTVDKMATYKGAKLHGKRNLLKQFLELYTPEARPLTTDRMGDAKNILEEWQIDMGTDKKDTDYHECLEAFSLYEELILCGGIYYIGTEPAGFIIGEELSEDVFALHFAKGKRKFKGLYQYMYNNFAKILPAKYKLFNFEEDLGNLALRIAKSSYEPDEMLRKYRVRLRK